VPCDDDGLDLDAVATLAARTARLLYTVPTFQNPTGRRFRSRAGALVTSPRARGCGSSRTTPTAVRPAAGCRRGVASVPAPGARDLDASKVAAPPADRLAAGPGAARPPVVAKQAADLHSSTIDQAAAAAAREHRRRARREPALRASRRAPRRALTAAAALPPVDPNRPTAACSSGRACRTGGTPSRCCSGAARRRVRAGFRSSRAAGLRHAGSFSAHPPGEIAEGSRACGLL
jgi:2-aminoadipate transaminase